jgi:hypothetical protein
MTGGEATKRWGGSRMISEEVIDKTLNDTFPASDPPSWTLGIEQVNHVDQSEHETQKLILDRAPKDFQPARDQIVPKLDSTEMQNV